MKSKDNSKKVVSIHSLNSSDRKHNQSVCNAHDQPSDPTSKRITTPDYQRSLNRLRKEANELDW